MSDQLTTTDRRTFMRRGAMGAGALWMFSLQEFAGRRAYAGSFRLAPGQSPYGPIGPKLDEATGLPLIMLPDGFRYKSFGWTGDLMDDGVRTPALHDGWPSLPRNGMGVMTLIMTIGAGPDEVTTIVVAAAVGGDRAI
jgi:uncharacterized protein